MLHIQLTCQSVQLIVIINFYSWNSVGSEIITKYENEIIEEKLWIKYL